jgi:DNA-binding transcriptional regulator YbjK
MTIALTPAQRAAMIGDAAITILAANGSRGLTHRAVDRLLGWPEGTTSRYHRTRDSLMNAVVKRLVEVEVAHVEHWQQDTVSAGRPTHADVAGVLDKTYQEWIGGGVRQIARYELSLEGRRRPVVHDAIISGRHRINASVGRLLQAAGCQAPRIHATAVVSLLDGMCHDHLLHPEIAVDPGDVNGVFLRWLMAC